MKAIRPLIFTNILCVSAMMAFLAVIGPIIRILGLKEWHAGLTVALGGVMWILFSRFWGIKSDRQGRKKILITAVAGFSVFYLILAVFVNFAVISPPVMIVSLSVLVFTRGIIGLFYSAIPPVSAAVVADKTPPEQRASSMAALGASNGLGMILGPVVGGLLAVYGLAVPLYAAAVFPLAAVIVLAVMLTESHNGKTEGQQMLKITDKRLRYPSLAAFITMYSVVTCQICMGFFVLDRLGYEAIEGSRVTGYVLSACGISFIAIQIIVTKVKSITPETWMKLGAVTAFFGFILTALSNTAVFLALALCIGTVGMGMVMPAFQAITANSVSKDEQGAAAGTVSAFQGIGIIAGPLASTMLYGINPSLPFIVAASAFAFMALWALFKRI